MLVPTPLTLGPLALTFHSLLDLLAVFAFKLFVVWIILWAIGDETTYRVENGFDACGHYIFSQRTTRR